MTVFHHPTRIYYEDTDAGGVVYYANYLRFFERCRTEWLRSLGYEQIDLLATHDIALMDQYDARRLVIADGRLYVYD